MIMGESMSYSSNYLITDKLHLLSSRGISSWAGIPQANGATKCLRNSLDYLVEKAAKLSDNKKLLNVVS